MNNKESHIRQLLKRWVSGDIKSQGEQRLDKAAKEDKFLGEALSGLRSITEHDHEQSLDRLRKQLKEKKSRVFYLTPLRIAASVALLLTAGWFIWTGPSLNSDQNIAMSKEIAPDNDAISHISTEKTDDSSTIQTAPAVEAPKASTNNSASRPAPSKKRLEELVEEEEIMPPPSPVAPIITENDDLFSTNAGSGVANSSAPASDIPNAEKDTAPLDSEYLADINNETLAAKQAVEEDYARALEQKAAALSIPIQADPMMISNMGTPVAISGYRMIDGYVTDREGYPLIGANILEEGTENGTISDINGYFIMAVKEGNNTQLVCSYTGFEMTNILLDEKTNYAITLSEESILLSEVVVTAQGSRRNQKSISYSASQIEQVSSQEIFIIEPLGGFKALKSHIRQNTPRGTRRGKVRLRFIVSADGRPSNISVIHSTNTLLNDLAKELIASGPDWVITTSDESVEVEYLMRIR